MKPVAIRRSIKISIHLLNSLRTITNKRIFVREKKIVMKSMKESNGKKWGWVIEIEWTSRLRMRGKEREREWDGKKAKASITARIQSQYRRMIHLLYQFHLNGKDQFIEWVNRENRNLNVSQEQCWIPRLYCDYCWTKNESSNNNKKQLPRTNKHSCKQIQTPAHTHTHKRNKKSIVKQIHC